MQQRYVYLNNMITSLKTNIMTFKKQLKMIQVYISSAMKDILRGMWTCSSKYPANSSTDISTSLSNRAWLEQVVVVARFKPRVRLRWHPSAVFFSSHCCLPELTLLSWLASHDPSIRRVLTSLPTGVVRLLLCNVGDSGLVWVLQTLSFVVSRLATLSGHDECLMRVLNMSWSGRVNGRLHRPNTFGAAEETFLPGCQYLFIIQLHQQINLF